ncbi:polyamine-modulated factor 1-binding protein 1-like [Ceratina calcarata]|uniref:Polyamine-modulated factor 1-binding protein 1-like n=1 Tax=Ceratina calcarata TaxID=156304 RepID=A0AAJ7W8H2_9HYME|nr:polyamine-modulated factor 1-binding protein 1-like [Ceratina calcarata]
MSYCESCTLAGMAIIQAINEIEQVFGKNKLVSVAAIEKYECKNDIYERTQWAVMSRLSRGIGRDVGTALSMVKETNLRTQAVKRDHDQAIRELRISMMAQEERAEALQAENLKLKDSLQNARGKLTELESSNADSKEEKETLEGALNDTRSRLSTLAGENNVLQSQTVALAESKLELEKTVIGLRKEIVVARDAYLETERRYQALLDESRKENDSLKNEYEEKVEQLHQEIASLRAQIINKKEKKKTKIAEDNGPVKENQDGTVLKPEDDPVADMTQQLISNREKIELLSRQNERLSKTLCRLREYRQTTATGSNK